MMSVKRIVAAAAAVCVACAMGSDFARAGDTWEITVVDTSGDTGAYATIAILPTGRPGISYQDLQSLTLRYAALGAGGWETTVVDSGGDSGEYNSLAVLPSGYPAISYHDVDASAVNYAEFDGTRWQIATVDDAFAGDFGTSLAILPSGQPAVSYRDHWNGWLKYAYYDGAAWITMVVDDSANVGHQSSLAILPSGQPAISYLDYTNDRLMYAWYDGRDWHTEIAAEPGGVSTRLVILPSGNPAIVHEAAQQLRYVEFDGEGWRATILDSVTGWESWFGQAGLAVQPSGEPAICYARRQFPDEPVLYYAWRETGEWQTSQVMVGSDGQSDLAFLPTGQPAISFRNDHRLMYATPPAIPGDVDGDGDVDLADLATLLAAYDACIGDPLYNPAADIDGSGCVELADLAALLANYG